MKPKLKAGIIINGSIVQAWLYKVIETIVYSDYAEISLVIYCPGIKYSAEQAGQHENVFSKVQKKLDMLLFASNEGYHIEKDLDILIRNVPEIRLQTSGNTNDLELAPEDAKLIRGFNLDVIIKLSSGNFRGEILKSSRYGLWSFSIDPLESNFGLGSGYYEVVTRNPVSSVSLLIMNEKGEEGVPIHVSHESTCSYSVYRNINKLCWRASLFIPRVLFGIYKYGSNYLEKLKERSLENGGPESSIHEDNKPGPRRPRPFRAAGMLASKLVKKAIFTDPFSWVLLINISTDRRQPDSSYKNYQVIRPSKDKFWADPFVVSLDDRHLVFVEEFIYSQNRAHLSVLELDEKGNLLGSSKIIEKPYHMSYPHVFEVEGSYYMIPETSENQTIDLYKAIEFPYKWTFVKHLMDKIKAVDSTLFWYENKWWLFTLVEKIAFASDNSSELFLFYSDDFLSDNWKSHPLNPVVSDVRKARPAGNIYINNGIIYRPSQDCSGRYGEALNINEISVITETDYRETELIKTYPNWDKSLKGIHTLNFNSNFSVVDAYYYRKRFL